MKNIRKIMMAYAIACIVLAGCGSKTQQAAEPAAEETVEAATEKAVEAATEKAVETATEKAVEAATEKAVEPAAEEAAETAAEETVDPAAEETVDPVAEEAVEPAPGEAVDSDPEKVIGALAEAAKQGANAAEDNSGWNNPDKTKIDFEKQEIIYSDGVVIHYEINGEEATFTMDGKSLTVTGHPEGDPSSDGKWRNYLHMARLIIK